MASFQANPTGQARSDVTYPCSRPGLPDLAEVAHLGQPVGFAGSARGTLSVGRFTHGLFNPLTLLSNLNLLRDHKSQDLRGGAVCLSAALDPQSVPAIRDHRRSCLRDENTADLGKQALLAQPPQQPDLDCLLIVINMFIPLARKP